MEIERERGEDNAQVFLSLIWKIFEFCSFLASLHASASLSLPLFFPCRQWQLSSPLWWENLFHKIPNTIYLAKIVAEPTKGKQQVHLLPIPLPSLLHLRLESKQQPSTVLNSNQPHNLWFSDSDVSVPCPVLVLPSVPLFVLIPSRNVSIFTQIAHGPHKSQFGPYLIAQAAPKRCHRCWHCLLSPWASHRIISRHVSFVRSLRSMQVALGLFACLFDNRAVNLITI